MRALTHERAEAPVASPLPPERGEALNSLLESRRPRGSLVRLGVIKEEDKDVSSQALFNERQRQLKQAQAKDMLANFIASRPTAESLRERRILLDDDSDQRKQRAIRDAKAVLDKFIEGVCVGAERGLARPPAADRLLLRIACAGRPPAAKLLEQKVIQDIGDLPPQDLANGVSAYS